MQEECLYPREGRRICLEGSKLGRKGRLFVLEGHLRWREGRYLLKTPSPAKSVPFRVRRAPPLAGGRGAIYALNGAVMGERGTFRARRTYSFTKGAPYLLKRPQSCAERISFRASRAPLLAEGAPYQLRRRCHGQKGALAGGRGAVFA